MTMKKTKPYHLAAISDVAFVDHTDAALVLINALVVS
jgi:hypothetical protein